MKKTLLFSGILLALSASLALAGGIDFYWVDCLGSTDVNDNVIPTPTNTNFNCTASTATNSAIGSFLLTSPMPDFVAVEIVMDLQANAVSLPAWWTFDPAPGACHDGSLSMTFDFSILSNTACVDPFGTPAQGGLANYSPNGNRARILGVAAIAPPGRSLVAGQQYYGVRLALKRDMAATCAGCNTQVSIVLNDINAVGAAPNEHEDNTSPIHNQCVTYQGPNSSGCGATAVQNATWGMVKSLYR